MCLCRLVIGTFVCVCMYISIYHASLCVHSCLYVVDMSLSAGYKYVCVCVCVCMYVCMYYASLCVCIRVCVCVCMYVCRYASVPWIKLRSHAQLCRPPHRCECANTIYTHTHTHTL